MDQKEFCHTNKIKFFDKVMSNMELRMLRDQITNTPMTWTGKDTQGKPTNTLTKDFLEDDPILVRCKFLAYKLEPKLKHLSLYRAGINLIMPQTDPPYFHTDGEQIITCLIYITPKIVPDDGGETQFDLDNIIIGIKPLPGRFCIFDGSISHRTSYFRDTHRITIFLKFNKDPLYNIFND